VFGRRVAALEDDLVLDGVRYAVQVHTEYRERHTYSVRVGGRVILRSGRHHFRRADRARSCARKQVQNYHNAVSRRTAR
jgi:predicted alpha-1,6-mannanase (GH76 family)